MKKLKLYLLCILIWASNKLDANQKIDFIVHEMNSDFPQLVEYGKDSLILNISSSYLIKFNVVGDSIVRILSNDSIYASHDSGYVGNFRLQKYCINNIHVEVYSIDSFVYLISINKNNVSFYVYQLPLSISRYNSNNLYTSLDFALVNCFDSQGHFIGEQCIYFDKQILRYYPSGRGFNRNKIPEKFYCFFVFYNNYCFPYIYGHPVFSSGINDTQTYIPIQCRFTNIFDYRYRFSDDKYVYKILLDKKMEALFLNFTNDRKIYISSRASN